MTEPHESLMGLQSAWLVRSSEAGFKDGERYGLDLDEYFTFCPECGKRLIEEKQGAPKITP